jgi:hypothetical protein
MAGSRTGHDVSGEESIFPPPGIRCGIRRLRVDPIG